MSECGGFTSIKIKAGWAIDSMFAVGAQSGDELIYNCPDNTVVTGIAGGMSPEKDSKGWISNLQFQCRFVLPLVQVQPLEMLLLSLLLLPLSSSVAASATATIAVVLPLDTAHTRS